VWPFDIKKKFFLKKKLQKARIRSELAKGSATTPIWYCSDTIQRQRTGTAFFSLHSFMGFPHQSNWENFQTKISLRPDQSNTPCPLSEREERIPEKLEDARTQEPPSAPNPQDTRKNIKQTLTWGVFSSRKFLALATVALSFIFVN
jgi:hypothetical protein